MRVDATTVKALEGKAPSCSLVDRARLQFLIKKKKIFELFSDDERQVISRNLEHLPARIIPTQNTFFRDAKYLLKPWSDCVKWLLPQMTRTSSSLFTTLSENFIGADSIEVELSERRSERRSCDETDAAKIAYLQLFIFAMRHWPQIPAKPLKKGSKAKASAQADKDILRGYGDLAYRLGYYTEEIQRIIQLPESRISDTAICQAECVTENDGPSARHRSGGATVEAHEHDKRFTFWDNLTQSPVDEDEHITSFFVLKCQFFAFFSCRFPGRHPQETVTENGPSSDEHGPAPFPSPSSSDTANSGRSRANSSSSETDFEDDFYDAAAAPVSETNPEQDDASREDRTLQNDQGGESSHPRRHSQHESGTAGHLSNVSIPFMPMSNDTYSNVPSRYAERNGYSNVNPDVVVQDTAPHTSRENHVRPPTANLLLEATPDTQVIVSVELRSDNNDTAGSGVNSSCEPSERPSHKGDGRDGNPNQLIPAPRLGDDNSGVQRAPNGLRANPSGDRVGITTETHISMNHPDHDTELHYSPNEISQAQQDHMDIVECESASNFTAALDQIQITPHQLIGEQVETTSSAQSGQLMLHNTPGPHYVGTSEPMDCSDMEYRDAVPEVKTIEAPRVLYLERAPQSSIVPCAPYDVGAAAACNQFESINSTEEIEPHIESTIPQIQGAGQELVLARHEIAHRAHIASPESSGPLETILYSSPFDSPVPEEDGATFPSQMVTYHPLEQTDQTLGDCTVSHGSKSSIQDHPQITKYSDGQNSMRQEQAAIANVLVADADGDFVTESDPEHTVENKTPNPLTEEPADSTTEQPLHAISGNSIFSTLQTSDVDDDSDVHDHARVGENAISNALTEEPAESVAEHSQNATSEIPVFSSQTDISDGNYLVHSDLTRAGVKETPNAVTEEPLDSITEHPLSTIPHNQVLPKSHSGSESAVEPSRDEPHISEADEGSQTEQEPQKAADSVHEAILVDIDHPSRLSSIPEHHDSGDWSHNEEEESSLDPSHQENARASGISSASTTALDTDGENAKQFSGSPDVEACVSSPPHRRRSTQRSSQIADEQNQATSPSVTTDEFFDRKCAPSLDAEMYNPKRESHTDPCPDQRDFETDIFGVGSESPMSDMHENLPDHFETQSSNLENESNPMDMREGPLQDMNLEDSNSNPNMGADSGADPGISSTHSQAFVSDQPSRQAEEHESNSWRANDAEQMRAPGVCQDHPQRSPGSGLAESPVPEQPQTPISPIGDSRSISDMKWKKGHRRYLFILDTNDEPWRTLGVPDLDLEKYAKDHCRDGQRLFVLPKDVSPPRLHTVPAENCYGILKKDMWPFLIIRKTSRFNGLDSTFPSQVKEHVISLMGGRTEIQKNRMKRVARSSWEGNDRIKRVARSLWEGNDNKRLNDNNAASRKRKADYILDNEDENIEIRRNKRMGIYGIKAFKRFKILEET